MESAPLCLIERAHIPKRYEHCDFESYVTDLVDGKTWSAQHTQSLKLAKSYTETFTRDFPGGSDKGLLFMGPSGVGKTHLAVAALKELIVRGHACLFCDYRELLKEIQASYNPASESTEMSILDPIRTIEVLVLDDLGASKPSDWVRDIVSIVLNARYNEKRTTIITTNYLDNPASAGEATRGPRRQAHPRRARRFARRTHRQPNAFPPLRNVPHHRSERPRFSPRTHPSWPRPRLIFDRRAVPRNRLRCAAAPLPLPETCNELPPQNHLSHHVDTGFRRRVSSWRCSV